jgi:hypothetical protein
LAQKKKPAAKADDVCKQCKPLRRERRLDCNRKYQRIAKRIDAGLADGSLIPDPDRPIGKWTPPTPYKKMRRDELTKGIWPDFFEYFFRCTACGTRFIIYCDIYHGGGGAWRIAKKSDDV